MGKSAPAIMSPFEALSSATRNAAMIAKRMNVGSDWGTIEVGNRADLVLLSNNPLEDISNSNHILGVMVRGRWIARDDLENELGGNSLADQLFGVEAKRANLQQWLAGSLDFDAKREVIEEWVHAIRVEWLDNKHVVSINYTLEQKLWPYEAWEKVRKGELDSRDMPVPSIMESEQGQRSGALTPFL